MKPPYGISQWSNVSPLPPPPPIHTTLSIVSVGFMAHSLPPKDLKVLPYDSQLDKGNKQVTSLINEKSSSYTHSKLK
jgi:hypothetical protein